MSVLWFIISLIEFLLLLATWQVRRKSGYAGTMMLVETDEKKTFILDSSDVDPANLDKKKRMFFKIVPYDGGREENAANNENPY